MRGIRGPLGRSRNAIRSSETLDAEFIRPVWTTVPAINFVQGQSSSVGLAQYVTDPDSTSLLYSVVSGTLPTGVVLAASSGLLQYNGSGPVDSATGVVFQVTDAETAPVNSNPVTVAIEVPAPVFDGNIGTIQPFATIPGSYSFAQDFSNNPTSYSISGPPLPTGFSFNTSTGLLSWIGTQTPGTTSGFTVTATNAGGSDTTPSFDLVVGGAPPQFVGNVSNITANIGSAGSYGFAQNFTGSGLTYAFSGTLPAGFSFNTSTGLLSWASSGKIQGTYTGFQVTATNAAGSAQTNTFQIAVELVVSWDSIPATLPAGTQLNMLQYLNDPQGVVVATRATGLTGGAAYNPTTGILTYGASPVGDVTMEADYDDGTTAGQAITSFTVNGTGTGAMTLGHVFAKGDAADVSVAGAQTIVKSRWNDNSVKHAIISGVFTGGQSYDVVASPQGSGVALTEQQLITALGTTTITLSGGLTGSVNAADLISGATEPDGFGKLAWQDGPHCIERIVSKEIASGVYGKFYCAYYSNGALRVSFCVDNSRAFDSPVQNFSNVTCTYVLAGTQVGQDTTTIWRRTRFRKTFWTSGGQLSPSPDLAYLDSTKAFPAYRKGSTTATHATSIAPYGQGSFRGAWGSGGYHPQIGPLPEWDAVCLRAGFNEARFNAMIAHAEAANGQCVLSGDITTGLPARLTQYPTANIRGWSQSNGLIYVGSGQPSWQQSSGTGLYSASHAPQCGALAYAVTGDFYFLETLWHYTNHSLLWTESSDMLNNRGTDLECRFDGEQARTHAWRMRDLAYSAFFGPDTGFSLVADYRTGIQSTVDYSYQQYVNPGPWSNSFGWPNSSDHPNPKPWQAYWVIASYMRIEELEVYSGPNIGAVNNFFATYIRHTTGNINDGWCWQYANYGNDSGNGIPAQSGTDFSASWADYYASSSGPGGTCNLSGQYFGDGPTIVTSYEANKLWAVSTAVDLGYITQADYDRHWNGWNATGKAAFSADPVWGTEPR